MLGKGDKEYAIPFYGYRRRDLDLSLIFQTDERIKEQYSEMRREKDILIAETDLPRPLGKVLTLMGKASPLYDGQDKLPGAIETIRDITASKQEDESRAANEEITATEAELRKQYEKLIRNEQVLKDRKGRDPCIEIHRHRVCH